MKPFPLVLCLPLLGAGCMHVKTDPIEVKPIHITVDVNVRIERALDDVFGALDAQDPSMKTIPEKKP